MIISLMRIGKKEMIAIIIPALVSEVVWAYSRGGDFSTLSLPMIGEVFGIAGLSYMFLSIATSTKTKFLDRMFGGLDKVYKVHKLSGQIALFLLVLHPLLLIGRYYYLGYFKFLFISGWLEKDIGVVSLYLLVAGVAAALYLRIRYEVWKIMHKFMVFVFMMASYHAISISPLGNPAKTYLLLLGISGSAVGIYSATREYFAGRRMKIKNVRIMGNVTEVELDGRIDFTPGQFIFIKFLKSGMNEFHPFSIVSEKNENLKIAAKALGDFTKSMRNLKRGDVAVVDGPYGGFSVGKGGRKQLWIAGGIGITPFVSMASGVNDRDVVLIYSVKRKDEFLYLERLQNIKLIKWVSSMKGRLNADIIMKLVPDALERDVFMCGPPAMMKSLEKGLRKKGVRKFIYEEFKLR